MVEELKAGTEVSLTIRATLAEDWKKTDSHMYIESVIPTAKTSRVSTERITNIEVLGIEEPSGFGAVVRDRDGTLWVRRHMMDTGWVRKNVGGYRAWDQIHAVEILFDGVPA